jgi:hypothetical protein
MNRCLVCILSALLLLANRQVWAQQTGTTEIEVGALQAQNLDVASFQRASATADWRKTGPTIRLEYWTKQENDWRYGIVFQPLYFRLSGRLADQFEYKATTLNRGDSAQLTYQFHTARVSANYPVYEGQQSDIRLGASLILRYFNTNLSSATGKASSVNILALPLPNIEAKYSLSANYSLNLRADVFPTISGSGLYDVLLALRQESKVRPVDIGLRFFGGSYDPNEVGNFRNKIFFRGLVLRTTF